MKPIEHFAEALSRLNEKKFFEISRNFLGDVKTPYHKQAIIERLLSCLSAPRVQEAILSYISPGDSLMIKAVELLDSPAMEDIYGFFTAQYSYTQCIRMVTSLEERLLIYSFTEAGRVYYTVNAALKDVTDRLPDHKTLLFPYTKTSGPPAAPAAAAIPDKRFFLAVFSFVYTGRFLLKKSNALTQKTTGAVSALFPGYDFPALLEALRTLELVERAEQTYTVNPGALKPFLALSDIECRVYLAAGMCGDKRLAPLLAAFLASLPPGNQYPSGTLRRIAKVVSRKTAFSPAPPFERMLNALLASGLLAGTMAEDPQAVLYQPVRFDPAPDEHAAAPDGHPAAPDEHAIAPDGHPAAPDGHPAAPDEHAAAPAVVFDTPFSFIVLPRADTAAVSDAIYFSTLDNTREFRFTITKEASVRCFKTGGVGGNERAPLSGGNASWIIERLKTLSKGRLDDTLVWTVREWEKRFAEVVLYEGLALYLGGDRAYLAETAALQPYLQKKLAENVFFIEAKHKQAVQAALIQAGIDIIGSAGQETPAARRRPPSAGFPPPFAKPYYTLDIVTEKPREEPAPPVDWRGAFKDQLQTLKTTPANAQELLARIERGLIVSAEQLQKLAMPDVFAFERTEARGMDYNGKLLIAKSALQHRTPVELAWHAGGSEQKAICMVAAIEKSRQGDILILLTDSGKIEVPLAKISVIRRIKSSIFD
jgi:hypothetical protein